MQEEIETTNRVTKARRAGSSPSQAKLFEGSLSGQHEADTDESIIVL